MFKYTFEVIDWETRKPSNIVKTFNEKLSLYDVRKEMGIIFDTGLYKWVSFKKEVQIDELGNIIKKFNIKKW